MFSSLKEPTNDYNYNWGTEEARQSVEVTWKEELLEDVRHKYYYFVLVNDSFYFNVMIYRYPTRDALVEQLLEYAIDNKIDLTLKLHPRSELKIIENSTECQ